MTPDVVDGWVCFPYDGDDLARVELGVRGTEVRLPAFLDWHDGQRVAKLRPAALVGNAHRAVTVELHVDGVVTASARMQL